MTLFRPIVSAAASALALVAAPALADVALPAPYVSRALDAVLLPIDANVRDAFALGASDTGVLVLTTEPGGVADANGILPGDVLSVIGGRKVSKPLDVDTIVYYWLLDGVTDFEWSLLRGGDTVEVYTLISEESYWEVIDVTTIETWSITEEVSFSYEEYWSEYSEEITESYESSETLIEETVTSEEFTSEVEESYEEAEEFTVALRMVRHGSITAIPGGSLGSNRPKGQGPGEEAPPAWRKTPTREGADLGPGPSGAVGVTAGEVTARSREARPRSGTAPARR